MDFSLKALVSALRPSQWYKNLLVFLAVIFAGRLFIAEELLLTFYGFALLCLVSAANYLINDVFDFEEDRKNPLKKKRAIASGRIGKRSALLMGALLFLAAFSFSLYLENTEFTLAVLGLFALGQSYTFLFKRLEFLSSIVIGIGFALRAGSGAFLINAVISPWLILISFFLAVFLSLAKKNAEKRILGETKTESSAAEGYFFSVISAVLVVSYVFYCFMSVEGEKMLLTLPFALMAFFKYGQLMHEKPEMVVRTEKALFDKQMRAVLISWLLAVLAVLYLRLP